MVTLHRYFIGSSLCFIVFVLSSACLDFLFGNVFYSGSYLGLPISALAFISVPFLYGTTLATILMYVLIKRNVSGWNYAGHCLLSGLLFSILFGFVLFELSFSDWLKFPLTYSILIGAAAFAFGKFIPVKKATVYGYFIPLLAVLLSIVHINARM